MADNEESGLIDEVENNSLNSNTVEIGSSGIVVEESEGVNEDILEQAFAGTEDFEHVAVGYSVQQLEQADSDDTSQSVAQHEHLVSTSAFDSARQLVTTDTSFGSATYRVVDTLTEGSISLPDDLMARTTVSERVTETEETRTEIETGEVSLIDSQDQDVLLPVAVADNQQELRETVHAISQPEHEGEEMVEDQPQEEQQTIRFTLLEGGNRAGAPLGSSQNPIRIIQQGNNYTPVQQLTSDQLQQIMQVVHQQQVAKNTQESGGSVLFNPNTNTRIVYRVIYPSELHKGQQTVLHVTPNGTTSTGMPVHQPQVQKRQYRRRGKDEEEDKMDGPEMSKEEKEERKKHRPRTRSGRVSKPPKHMVKDYKHIHVLDWDEDYDDSDGGYSDYKGSDEEGRARARENSEELTPELHSGLAMSSSRPKNYKCQTCEKSYIGQAGLGRHYRLNPSHGVMPEDSGSEEKVNGEASAENTLGLNNGSAPSSISHETGIPTAASNLNRRTGNLSEDSNTQDSIPSSSGAVSPITTRPSKRGRGSFRGRGRWSFLHHTAPARKKQKLKELVKTIEDDDLMEVVLPRLVKFVTLWEFMLMKLETCNAIHPRVDHIYHEFLALHKHVKRVCQEGLQFRQHTDQENFLASGENGEGTADILKLEDEAIARSLGLKTGSYVIKDLPVNEFSSFHYKYLTSDPNGHSNVSAEKRTIQVVTPDELVPQSPSKRSRMASLLHTASPVTTVALVPSVAAASSLLTSFVTNSGLKDTISKHQPGRNFIHTVAIQQPQTSVLQTVSVQPPHRHVLQTVEVHQPQTVLSMMSVPSQHPVSAGLRTVSVSSINQSPSLLQNVAVHSLIPQSQTRLLQTVQQPLIVSSDKQTGLTGISLPNNSNSGIPQSSSVAVLKRIPGQTSQVVMAASLSPSVTGPSSVEIPSSQTAQIVSFLPSSDTNGSVSIHNHTTGDITAMEPEDFMDTSSDSLVRSESGLSCSNSSLVTAVNSSQKNGEMSDLIFTNVLKVNGVSDKSKLISVSADKQQVSVLNDSTQVTSDTVLQNSEHTILNNAVEIISNTDSQFIKCENNAMNITSITSEPFQLTSGAAYIITDDTGIIPTVNGQLGSSIQERAQFNVKKELIEEPVELLENSVTRADSQDNIEEGNVQLEVEESFEGPIFTLHQNATLFQTEDGTVILQNPDGTTFQLQGVGDQDLTLESVQELLSQMVSGDQVQTELQQ